MSGEGHHLTCSQGWRCSEDGIRNFNEVILLLKKLATSGLLRRFLAKMEIFSMCYSPQSPRQFLRKPNLDWGLFEFMNIDK